VINNDAITTVRAVEQLIDFLRFDRQLEVSIDSFGARGKAVCDPGGRLSENSVEATGALHLDFETNSGLAERGMTLPVTIGLEN